MAEALEKRIKKHVIGKPHRFEAVAPLGFENTLVEELKYIGIEAIGSDKDSGFKVTKDSGIKAADENSSIKVVGDGKVEFTAKITEAWKAVAYSRIANRVLMEIGSFRAENFGQLEKGAAGIPWELYLDERMAQRAYRRDVQHLGQRPLVDVVHPVETRETKTSPTAERNLDIHVTCKHSRLYHSDAVEERVRKAIENAFHASKNIPATPAVASATSASHVMANAHDKNGSAIESSKLDSAALASHVIARSYATKQSTNQAQHLYVRLQDDRCTLWLDLAGEELYKRGHERFVAEAPLKETIAAAMIFEAVRLQAPGSRHKKSSDNNHQIDSQRERSEQPRTSSLEPRTFIDPMAGSGTFSLEAAYIANGLIPGKCRDFALKHQPAFKEATWNFILKEANANRNVAKTSTNAIPNSVPKVIPATNTNVIPDLFRENIPVIITSDISERPVNIIKHNVECSPLAEIERSNPDAAIISPQLKDFFSYTVDDICAIQPPASPNFQSSIINRQSSIILLNPPYGKRLDVNAPRLYTRIGQKLSELSRDAETRGINLVVAILAPKDDSRNGSHYTCTANLLATCPALDPRQNPAAKLIETSHGGFSLNAFFAKI